MSYFKICIFFTHINSLTKEAVQTSPTIGSNVEEITVHKTHFLVWDIGGQESLRASWYSYYCNTEVRISECLQENRLKYTFTLNLYLKQLNMHIYMLMKLVFP